MSIARKNACMGCHAVDRKLVGPSFQQIAEKYKGDAQAPAKLDAQGEGRRHRRVGRDSDAVASVDERRRISDGGRIGFWRERRRSEGAPYAGPRALSERLGLC